MMNDDTHFFKYQKEIEKLNTSHKGNVPNMRENINRTSKKSQLFFDELRKYTERKT